MARTSFLAVAMAAFLAACTQTEERTADLAKTCQVRECTCTETSGSLFDSPGTADVLWREGGDAYCRPGYDLRLVPPPPPKPGGIPINRR